MLICAAGDPHGRLNRLYQEVLTFESALSATFAWVLQVGDMGIWPDAERVDRATRNHDGAGDFPTWWKDQRPAPRRTVFIKGNHEDFVWMDAQPQQEILPGLFYLKNGETFRLSHDGENVSVGGLGGCYGPSDFDRPAAALQGYAKRHYTRSEIAALSNAGHVDILLVHDAPKGVQFERHRRGASYVSEVAGLDELIVATNAHVCFFGHHHTRLSTTVGGVPCVGLNKVPMPGCLVAMEVRETGAELRGEWPSST